MQKFEKMIVEFDFYMYDIIWAVRNPAFGVFDHPKLKPACVATDNS